VKRRNFLQLAGSAVLVVVADSASAQADTAQTEASTASGAGVAVATASFSGLPAMVRYRGAADPVELFLNGSSSCRST
jgi:hypothetical protein